MDIVKHFEKSRNKAQANQQKQFKNSILENISTYAVIYNTSALWCMAAGLVVAAATFSPEIVPPEEKITPAQQEFNEMVKSSYHADDHTSFARSYNGEIFKFVFDHEDKDIWVERGDDDDLKYSNFKYSSIFNKAERNKELAEDFDSRISSAQSRVKGLFPIISDPETSNLIPAKIVSDFQVLSDNTETPTQEDLDKAIALMYQAYSYYEDPASKDYRNEKPYSDSMTLQEMTIAYTANFHGITKAIENLEFVKNNIGKDGLTELVAQFVKNADAKTKEENCDADEKIHGIAEQLKPMKIDHYWCSFDFK